jgi:polyhydroxybutyrate depolymerase
MFQGPRTATEDDITFTMDIMYELEQRLCVDTSRFYATGKSEGGGFAGMLACNETSAARIAAFAPVSGAFYPGT